MARGRLIQSISSAVIAVGLAGCFAAPKPLVNQRLDRATGLTVSTADAPMVFARTEGQYSQSARDYIYLGPVETNRQGVREYYLWVGVTTTLDRGFLAPENEAPETLYAVVHGEPMVLELEPWSRRVPGLGAMDLYDTAVESRNHLAARVSLHQLAILASEGLESVRVEDLSGRIRLYRRWDDGQSWRAFVRGTPASESLVTDRSVP